MTNQEEMFKEFLTIMQKQNEMNQLLGFLSSKFSFKSRTVPVKSFKDNSRKKIFLTLLKDNHKVEMTDNHHIAIHFNKQQQLHLTSESAVDNVFFNFEEVVVSIYGEAPTMFGNKKAIHTLAFDDFNVILSKDFSQCKTLKEFVNSYNELVAELFKVIISSLDNAESVIGLMRKGRAYHPSDKFIINNLSADKNIEELYFVVEK